MYEKLLAQIICTSPSTCTSNCTALYELYISYAGPARGEKGTTPSALNVGYCPAKSCGALGLRAPLMRQTDTGAGCIGQDLLTAQIAFARGPRKTGIILAHGRQISPHQLRRF